MAAQPVVRVLRSLHAFAWAILIPTMAYAQAQITGTVKDASGALVPGVTVEAASPALIEQLRAVVTDASGQYRLVDLRPGVYSVTFQLTGFSTFKREGIELPDRFVATINAELRVGALEETVTVTGETPIVDVQSVRRQTVLPGQTLRDLPVAHTYGSLLQMNPTVTATENKDVQVTPGRQFFAGAGGFANEGRIEVDGLSVGPPVAGGGSSSYNADVGNAQEVTTTSSGGLGESAVGGPSVSIVPRSGGNMVQGTVFVASVRDWMVGSNLSQDLINRGLAQPGDVEKLWDHNLGLGGPILENRLWFFTNLRDQGAHRKIPGMFANKNVGDPAKRTYEADLSRPAKGAGNWTTASLRLTNQITPRNRVGIFWDEQKPCHGGSFAPGIEACRQPKANYVLGGSPGSSSPFATATIAPEASSYSGGNYLRVQQATFTSTVSNRFLIEAGFGTYMNHWGGVEIPGNPTRDLVRVVEQCSAGCAANGGIAGLTYRSQNWAINIQKAVSWKTSASYVTARHSMKVGYQGAFNYTNGRSFTNNLNLQYRVNNGIPNQLTQNMSGYFDTKNRVPWNAVYVQEQWSNGRLTYQGALRYDYAWSYFPEQRIEANRFLSADVVIPRTKGVTGYHDLTPRGGVAWDLFGDGKTAVKINVGRYLQNAVGGTLYSGTNPLADIPVSVTRQWTDANNNFSPDCNLLNLKEQDLRKSGGDFCGTVSDLNFGTSNPSTTYDPALLGGWGVRPGDWQFGASIQQEVLPRVSVEVGYNRRWLVNFSVEDNLAVTPADFDPFSVTVPDDPRLPNAGQTISGLYNVDPTKFGQEDNFATLAKNYGGQSQIYNGLLLNASARPTSDLRLQFGINLGNTRFDTCALRTALPETAPLNPYCEYSTGLQMRITGLATYLVPKVDVSVSSTFRSDQGQELAANRAFSSASIVPSLGRPLSTGANATVNLVEPGTMYGDRLNVIDMRFAKVLRFGRTRTNVGFDVYNIFNRNPVITNNFTFVPGGTWLRPNSILAARFARFSATVDF